MKKILIVFMLSFTFLLAGCDGISEGDATILLTDTMASLQGSESAVFHVISTDHDKLIALNMEDYYDTIILRYNQGDMDYRYMNYVEVRLNEDNEALYYPIYYECGNDNPNCSVASDVLIGLDTLEDDSLYLFGERDAYAYLKGNDNYFNFYKFIDVAVGVIEYAVRDTENNIIINDIEESVFTGDLLGETIEIDTYTFTIEVDLEALQVNAPEIFMAMYWLDTADYDLSGVTQEITLEVRRNTNELVSFTLNQNFENLQDPTTVPFSRDYEFSVVLYKNGVEAYNYIISQPTLIPTPIPTNN